MSKTNPVLGGGGFHHVSIRTRDWSRTLRFYQEVLGFVVKVAWGAAPKRAIMLDSGDGNYLEVFEDLEFSPAQNGSILHFALRTTRLDAVVERVRASGESVTVEPKDITIATTNGRGAVPARICFFTGPNTELIELLQNDLT
jgi:glyoxylase I family protein